MAPETSVITETPEERLAGEPLGAAIQDKTVQRYGLSDFDRFGAVPSKSVRWAGRAGRARDAYQLAEKLCCHPD